MALTKTEVRNGRLGQFFDQFIDVALGTYATGGVAVDPKLFGMTTLLACAVVGGNAAAGGYSIIYDSTNKKLVAYRDPGVGAHAHDLLLKNAAVADSAGARVNAGANLLGANTGGDLTVTGGGANGGVQSFAAVAAVALAEVSNGVSLAAVTVRLRGSGF